MTTNGVATESVSAYRLTARRMTLHDVTVSVSSWLVPCDRVSTANDGACHGHHEPRTV